MQGFAKLSNRLTDRLDAEVAFSLLSGLQVRRDYRGPQHMYQVWEGVRVWRAPLWVPARPSGLKRLLHLASFGLCSLPLMLRQLAWRPDRVWVVEPPLFCAPTALCVARLHVQD